MLTTALELLCIVLVSLFLFSLYPPAALLPSAATAGLMAYVRWPPEVRARFRRSVR